MEGVISERSVNLYDSHWNDNVYSQEAATSVQWITTPEQPQVPFYNEMLHEQISYSYICEGGIALQSVLQDIYQCPIIAVDCEGFELGRDGILCLIQIATDSHVYIFDVLSLGTTLFDQGLRYILENPIPTKVFYDCRRDSDILYYHFGVKLKGVLDVALTEVFLSMEERSRKSTIFKRIQTMCGVLSVHREPPFLSSKGKNWKSNECRRYSILAATSIAYGCFRIFRI